MEKEMKEDRKGKTAVVWLKAPPHMGDNRAFSYMGHGMGRYRWGEPVLIPNEDGVHIRAMVNDGDFGDWEINGEKYPKKVSSVPKATAKKKESDD